MNNLPKVTQFIQVKLGLEPSSDLKAQALNCYLQSPQWTRERGARKVTRKTQNTSLKDKVAFAWGWQSTAVMDPAEESWGKSQCQATVARRPKPMQQYLGCGDEAPSLHVVPPFLTQLHRGCDQTTGRCPVWGLQQLATPVPIPIKAISSLTAALWLHLLLFSLLLPVKFSTYIIQQSYELQLTWATFLMCDNDSSLSKGWRHHVIN